MKGQLRKWFARLPREVPFALLWVLFLGLGFRQSFRAGPDVLDLFYQSAVGDVQFLGLVVSMLWPMVLASVGVLLYGRRGILPVCVVKGLSYGFCAGCTIRSFGSAGALAWFFLLFADTGMLWALCWYGLRRIHLGRSRGCRDLLPVGLAAVFFGLAEVLLIAPFLAELFS